MGCCFEEIGESFCCACACGSGSGGGGAVATLTESLILNSTSPSLIMSPVTSDEFTLMIFPDVLAFTAISIFIDSMTQISSPA